MKTKILLALAVTFLTSNSFAQNMSSTKISDDSISSKGFRMSIFKPLYEGEVKLSGFGVSQSDKKDLDNSIGFSIGYVSLPVRALGWTVNASYADLKHQNDSSMGLGRVDGNLAYAFTSILNLKGGLNVSKFVSGPGEATSYDAGLGYQVSLGVQLTKNFGLDVGYAVMNQSKSSGFKIDVKESGAEIALNGTF
ncbi:MAG TPA: hypothetical protein VN132_01160 [Bdellovibrio sp.]|nr:hypothetical protein [Bdellovibrio sp.]